MPEEKRRISPGVVVAGVGLAGLGALALAAMALAAPPVFTCPHCGATFATQEELNYHIQTEHPEVPPVAEFEVSDLIISPLEVQIGYPVSISCLVENIGTETGSKTITLEVNGEMAEQIVTLAPGGSEVVTFEVTPEVAKAYSVSVDGLYGSFVATEMPVADIRVENLLISPTDPMVGEIVTISVAATNYGTATGSKTIVCTVT